VLAVVIARDEEPEPRPAATLADYWAGRARWELAAKWTGELDASGAHIEIVGDSWYLFNRGRVGGTCPDGEFRVGVQVRESTDRGRTWSEPSMVIPPAPGTPWSCAATDGDAMYDRARGVWRYLFQCKADGGGWNGCYAERRGASPMGAFSNQAENPVIRAGELWGEICDPGDGCAQQPLRDEGTFNIFDRDSRGWWVSFHGSDGTRGYRGIAVTPDFREFVVDRPDVGVPSDAFLDAGDATGFREAWVGGQSIGAGAGTIVVEGDYRYALNEFADISLACTDGQRWDLGLFRSASTASTGWEPFPGGNPIVFSSLAPEANGKPPGCNVLYPSLFRDPATGTWYLMHGRGTSDPAHQGIYVYRLVADTSLLVNEDFAAGDARGWTAPPGAAVLRLPNGSPDGTPYLSLSGGNLTQDVPVGDALSGRDFTFGGTFRADGSPSARVRLAVQQFDGAGRPLGDDTADLVAGATYQRARGSGTVRKGTRVLRYAAAAEGAVAADNLFLTPAR
jgi:hypothetical protein